MKHILLFLPIIFLTGCPMSMQDVDSYKAYCIRHGGTPDMRITLDNQVVDVMCVKDGVKFQIGRRDVAGG